MNFSYLLSEGLLKRSYASAKISYTKIDNQPSEQRGTESEGLSDTRRAKGISGG